MENVQITSPGVKKTLHSYTPLKALVEFVWNGFDANATCVSLSIVENEMMAITGMFIEDNGYGIAKNELNRKFRPFNDSEKMFRKERSINPSAIHGKNGVGRLTFYHFAKSAKWSTVYQENDDKKTRYNITINSTSLDSYESGESAETEEETGTIVEFSDVFGFGGIDEIKKYLIKEFCWYLELNKDAGYSLLVNGEILNYTANIADSERFTLNHEQSKLNFVVRYIQWSEKINNEYSRYYFINDQGTEIYKDTTTLNNKGDHFYHSVFIESAMFDNCCFSSPEDDQQSALFGYTRASEEFKFLKKSVDNFLKKKRKPYLKKYSNILIDELEAVKAFPNYNLKDTYEKQRKSEVESLVREIYQLQPKIFSNLNIEQKKTIVRFLDLIMRSGERDDLLEILDEIIDLDTDERKELIDLLNSAKLSNIIKTMKLIKDRYTAIGELKQLVYNKALRANEVAHLQTFIENHYWIFGEQYNLVTAAEPDFEEALRRYTYYLTGEDKPANIDHRDKNKEMDIFAVRRMSGARPDEIQNIVVELKHPNISIGEKELSQVKSYMRVIVDTPEFNGNNMTWDFYLVGTKFSENKYIKGELDNNKAHGERSLVFKTDRYRIFVKTWSEVFTEFEIKHKYLNDKLDLERRKLSTNNATANDIIANIHKNTAIQPPEIIINVNSKTAGVQ